MELKDFYLGRKFWWKHDNIEFTIKEVRYLNHSNTISIRGGTLNADYTLRKWDDLITFTEPKKMIKLYLFALNPYKRKGLWTTSEMFGKDVDDIFDRYNRNSDLHNHVKEKKDVVRLDYTMIEVMEE